MVVLPLTEQLVAPGGRYPAMDDVAASAASHVFTDGRLCFAAASFLWSRSPTLAARLIARGAELVELARAWEAAAAAEGSPGSSRTPIPS